jgi:hypothetical protein
LNAAMAMGIGIGSMIAGLVSGNKIEYGLIPLGSIGMTCTGFALGGMHFGLVGSGVQAGRRKTRQDWASAAERLRQGCGSRHRRAGGAGNSGHAAR